VNPEPSGEEGHEGDLALAAELDDRLVLAVEDAVGVLHLAEVDELERSLYELATHVRDSDQVELALPAEVLQRTDLLGQIGAARLVHQAQVDQVHALDAQGAQVVLDALAQLLRGERGQPGAGLVAAGADLRHELEVLRVGMERLADEVVDHVGAVVLRGVDVVDAELDGAAQDGAGAVGVARRAEDAGAGELHGAESDAADGLVAQEGGLVIGHGL
jgi:hypothetical protein